MNDVPASFFREAREAVRRRVNALHAALETAGWPAPMPAGGFYLFADARKAMHALGIDNTRDLCVRLATESGVGLTPGSDFGQEGWVRASAVGLENASSAADVADRLLRFTSGRPFPTGR
jgi:aspartate/methionine/tyrosine aminotransferase